MAARASSAEPKSSCASVRRGTVSSSEHRVRRGRTLSGFLHGHVRSGRQAMRGHRPDLAAVAAMRDHERAKFAGAQRRQRHQAMHGAVEQVGLVVQARVADDFAELDAGRLAESTASPRDSAGKPAPGASSLGQVLRSRPSNRAQRVPSSMAVDGQQLTAARTQQHAVGSDCRAARECLQRRVPPAWSDARTAAD